MDALRGSLVDHHLAEIRKHVALSRAAPTRDSRMQKLVDAFSWSDLIAQTRVRFDRGGAVDPHAGGLRSGAAAELCQEVARDDPNGYDPFHPTIPWAVLAKRDVSVAAGGGGYLVEAGVTPVEELLRPWSIVVSGGVQVLPNLRADITVPKESAGPTGYWLANETATITESAPTIGAIPMAPKMCGDLLDVSRLLRLTGANLDTYLRNTLLKTIGALIDVAVIAGNGTSQPQGIIGTVGVGATTGGTFALSHVLAARAAVATANATDANVVWVGTPAVRQLLAARQRFSGVDSAIWQDDKIDARPAYVSTAVPAGDLLCGDFSTVTLGIWGQGVQVEITDRADQAHFMAGVTTMRVLVGVDVAVRQPAALYVVTSIT